MHNSCSGVAGACAFGKRPHLSPPPFAPHTTAPWWSGHFTGQGGYTRTTHLRTAAGLPKRVNLTACVATDMKRRPTVDGCMGKKETTKKDNETPALAGRDKNWHTTVPTPKSMVRSTVHIQLGCVGLFALIQRPHAGIPFEVICDLVLLCCVRADRPGVHVSGECFLRCCWDGAEWTLTPRFEPPSR